MLPNRQAEVSHLRADTQAQSSSAFHPLELHLIFTSQGWAFPWITNKDGLSLSPPPPSLGAEKLCRENPGC